MEDQIHQLEHEAYSAVLRAFKAQSDALTWEKEGLMTELRKELKVSDNEHRELVRRVNSDTIIHLIRQWRQTGCYQPPTVSVSGKKQKTSHLGQSLTEAAAFDPLIGKKVWTRRPQHKHFYEAGVTDYNAVDVCLELIIVLKILDYCIYIYLMNTTFES